MRISDWSSDVCSSDLSARAPAQRVRPVAVEHVLAHIEVEGREVDGAEGVDRLVEGVEVEVFYVLAHLAVELGQAVQHPALQLRHLGSGETLALVEAVAVAEIGRASCRESACQYG